MPTLRLRKSPKTKKQLSRNGKLARTSKKIKKTKPPEDTELLQLSNELECLAQSDFAGLPRGLLSRVAPVSVSVDIIYVIIQ